MVISKLSTKVIKTSSFVTLSATMRSFFLLPLLLVLSLSSCVLGKKKNVLFLVSDDMRPELTSFLGPDFPSPVHPRLHTPHLDQLAAKSLVLKRAYVQQAVSLCFSKKSITKQNWSTNAAG